MFRDVSNHCGEHSGTQLGERKHKERNGKGCRGRCVAFMNMIMNLIKAKPNTLIRSHCRDRRRSVA